LTISYPNYESQYDNDVPPPMDMQDQPWSDGKKAEKGPYTHAVVDAKLPENSFSSPKTQRSGKKVEPPNILAAKHELNHIKHKYDNQDPLKAALGSQSGPTQLFQSKAQTETEHKKKLPPPSGPISKAPMELDDEDVNNVEFSARRSPRKRSQPQVSHQKDVNKPSAQQGEQVEFDEIGTDKQVEKKPKTMVGAPQPPARSNNNTTTTSSSKPPAVAAAPPASAAVAKGRAALTTDAIEEDGEEEEEEEEVADQNKVQTAIQTLVAAADRAAHTKPNALPSLNGFSPRERKTAARKKWTADEDIA
jgi:hypothetical protein